MSGRLPWGSLQQQNFSKAQQATQTAMKTAALLLLVAVAILSTLLAIIMSQNISSEEFTTNAHDQAEAAKLQARLKESSNASQQQQADFTRIPSVQIADGRHKYVLISAREPSSDTFTYFVTSKKGAAYHRNAAEPLVYSLEQSGYRDIEITGGGRITLDRDNKTISVFGFSYSFGQAKHEISRQVILEDERFKDYNVHVSNEGY